MCKQLYIISGCNGAGKTTASYTILPEIWKCREFVNADEIARGLSPFNPESMVIEAGRLMLHRIDELLFKEESFSIETTLATRSYSKLVTKARNLGYMVTLLFFWLDSPELAIDRVSKRVKDGGHGISENIIRRRYYMGINHLFNIFIPIVDNWMIVDNSNLASEIIAEGFINKKTIIKNEIKYSIIKNYGTRKS